MEDLYGIVENEGLGYAIHSYISHERVPEKVADAWRRASEAMDEIQAALAEVFPDDDEEEEPT